MKGIPATYLGRIVDKEHFRAFIYGPNGQKRLVESWEEFEANMESGIWFASIEDANANKEIVKPVEMSEKPKSKSKAKPKTKPVLVKEAEDLENILPEDGSVFEVTDDFLPNENG